MVIAKYFHRHCEVMNQHAVGHGQFLFVAAGTHLFRSSPVNEADLVRAEAPALHGYIDRGHATADDNNSPADRQLAQILCLAQFRDVIDGVQYAVELLTVDAEFVDAAKSKAEEHGVIFAAQIVQRELAPERLPVANIDAADCEDELHFGLREVLDRLVSSNPVLVQATRLVVAIEHDNVVTQHRQAMRARQSRRAATYYGHALAA